MKRKTRNMFLLVRNYRTYVEKDMREWIFPQNKINLSDVLILQSWLEICDTFQLTTYSWKAK